MGRLRWMATGLAVGVGGSVWARRKLEDLRARLHPSSLTGRALRRVSKTPEELRQALREGRQAMAEAEAELRARQYPNPRGLKDRRPSPRGGRGL